MRTALAALLSLLLVPTLSAHTLPLAPAGQSKPKPAPRRSTAPANVVITVTDGIGQPIADVSVIADGPLDRSGSTGTDGTLRLLGMRAGTYRLRFDADGYVPFEKEITTRAGQKPLEVSVMLTAAPEPPAPPPPPPAPAEPELPPPGEAKSLELPDWLEKNLIGSREPQKESIVGCSGVAQALVWQVRDPWTGQQHTGADGMLYVIGGEGSLTIDDAEMPLSAGTFAVVPRGATFSLNRRGRSPLFVLAVLAGAPCSH